ncbi:MAG TPA: hypothetical protein VJ453_02475 [Terriglobales bacterium]|jgi:hypothetical protein|nr:hypothetical protein [Terriglobales bacterium]
MALPGKRDELNRVHEQAALNRTDEQRQPRADRTEHYAIEDRAQRDQRLGEEQHAGHNFDMDVHPDRYPRAALSRLEEGILEDDAVRSADDRLGESLPDVEHRVDELRNLGRMLVTLGSFLLIFACVLLLWVGWDVRSGSAFFSSMCAVAVVIGLGLIGWGLVERQRVLRLNRRMARTLEVQLGQTCRERDIREDAPAA